MRSLRTTCILAILACCPAFSGCFHPTIEDGGFACDPTLTPACPSGFFCVAGRCRTSPNASGGGGGSSADDGSAGGGGNGGGGGNAGGGGGIVSGNDLATS